MKRATISLTIDKDFEKKLREVHRKQRIKNLQEKGEDLPFSRFLEDLLKVGLDHYKQ
jgi:hypothetical protein